LAFLPTVFGKESLASLASPVVWGLLVFHLGVVAAIVHNHYRRECSLIHSQHDFRPPGGTIFGIRLVRPRVCFIERAFMWLSIALFLAGGVVVFGGAFSMLSQKEPCHVESGA
jgi:hypothetical protein